MDHKVIIIIMQNSTAYFFLQLQYPRLKRLLQYLTAGKQYKVCKYTATQWKYTHYRETP